MYALNESFPWAPADQQPVVDGDSLHWCNYTLGLYSLLLALDKTEIAPGDDITATVTWTSGDAVTEPAAGADVYVSDTIDEFGNPVPPGTAVGSTNASGELTFTWSTEGDFWPYAEFNGKSSIGQWPVPTFTCTAGYPNWDVNQDGSINILDVACVGLYWGSGLDKRGCQQRWHR